MQFFVISFKLAERKLYKNDLFLLLCANFVFQVILVPPALARKRVWNKKYPICITLADGEVGEESLVEGPKEGKKAEVPWVQVPITLYLFGRTGREKEEWFQHFLSASKTEAQNHLSDEENSGTKEACNHFNIYLVETLL